MLSWLDGVFQTVLNMSIAAAVIIAAVLLARLLLRRAPKAFSYALWAVVLFRLLCPVSVSSAVKTNRPMRCWAASTISRRRPIALLPAAPVTRVIYGWSAPYRLSTKSSSAATLAKLCA